MILALLVCSLAASLFLAKYILVSSCKHVRFGIALLLALFLTADLYMWFNPVKFGEQARKADAASASRFTVGPYPDLDKLAELKKAGYTGVISLLHPAVMPFETTLIETEKANTGKTGIKMIHLPMLPWISENRSSLARLTEIAGRKDGRYYLHCYLGKDRVNVALRTIADADPSVRKSIGFNARSLSMRRKLERGQVMMPMENVYLIPYPTREELFGFIMAANITNVVCLMDPNEENSVKIMAEAELMLAGHGVKQVNCPIKRNPYQPVQIREAVARVKEMTGAVVVYDFDTPSFRTEAFVQACSDERPCLPPALTASSVDVAPVRHLAPNVISGRRPVRLAEFEQLEKAGVQNFLYVGSAEEPEAVRDRELAGIARFNWQVTSDESGAALEMVKTGGPWYVYGRLNKDRLDKWAELIGPAYMEPADHVVVPPAKPSPPKPPSRFEIALGQIKNPAGSVKEINPVKVIFDFALNSAPSTRTLILFTPFCVFYTWVCAGYAGWLRMSRNIRVSYTRKVFHFLIFTMACFVQAWGGIEGTIVFGTVVCCSVMYAILRGNGYAFYEAMARPTDEPHRSLYIFIPMVTTAIGGVIANIFFQPVALVGYLVGGWGDAVGEPIGAKWGKHRYKVPSMMGVPASRSIEGSVAVMIAAFLAALAGLALMGAPMDLAFKAAAAAAVAACLIEAISTHGLDNLTVQIVASAVIFFVIRYAG
jgi:phytol kinase